MLRPALSIALAACTVGIHAASSAGAIERCTQGGAVSYTDLGCPSGALVLSMVSGSPPAPGRSSLPPVIGSADDPRAALAPGMSFRDVIALSGVPRETTVHWRRRVLTETWTWSHRGRTVAVTFRDGRVADR